MEFKDKVNIVRQKLIMSQEELAKALGISYGEYKRHGIERAD
jgi:DNA-binding XRE family transcriptional regulator